MNRAAGIRILVAAVTAAVVAAVIGAIVVLGSPAQQRQRHLDERRVRDLSSISATINLYASTHGALPPDLAALGKEPGPRHAPNDPDTGAPYDYSVLTDESYRLCATFALPSPETDAPYMERDGWTHAAGRQCFERKQKAGKN
jgi:type II secretory pathway pseudopilin PulG